MAGGEGGSLTLELSGASPGELVNGLTPRPHSEMLTGEVRAGPGL